MLLKVSPQDKAYKEWLDLCLRIQSATQLLEAEVMETEQQRQARIADLLKPNNFEKFCKYYFPHYIDSDFAWFHKKAAKEIITNDDIMIGLEWPREHAKSVFVDVFIPMYLKATGKLSGMILASENESKAAKLLGDLQAELMENKRFANDYGAQRTIGNWSEGTFVTTDGVGFWSFGLGQNPAGVRSGAKRPNYCVVDDAANRRRSKNQERIKEDVDWVLQELMGCCAIKASRFVFANNRTASNDLMAHLVGDVNEGDPIRQQLVHIKAFAFEDPRTHKMLLPDNGGVPSWSRYTAKHLLNRMAKFGHRAAMRNFFHIDIKDGDVFKEEDLPWVPCLPLDRYDSLLSYCDPSYKDNGDTKSIVLIGKLGSKYHILWTWLRHASRKSMVLAHYTLDRIVRGKERCTGIKVGKQEVNCSHWLEANFIQEDLFMGEYKNQGELRIRGDKRAKPDKAGRIEDLSPIAESGNLCFNEAMQKDPDMIALRDQFLSFPNGHDDGPDSVEGGIYLLNKRKASNGRQRNFKRGTYRSKTERSG